MTYGAEWKRKFIKRTLGNLKKYKGGNNATMLCNSMLGLLVVPRERMLDDIPVVLEHDLPKWGAKAGSVKNFGRHRERKPDKSKGEKGSQYTSYLPNTLPGLVHSLRNAIVHFSIEPIEKNLKVVGFKFRDYPTNGFRAELETGELLELCTKLARHLLKHGTHFQ